jgi:lipopolysaccharide assembly outer membrane protein LptD (OstA)
MPPFGLDRATVRSVATGALAALLTLGGGAAAQGPETLRSEIGEEGFTLHADQIDYERDQKIYTASGNVRIEQPSGRRLTADWVTFNPETRMGVATGNVEIVDGPDRVRAQFAAVNFDTLEALLTDAELDADRTGFRVRAQAIEKLTEETYRVDEGAFTTCRCPPGERLPFEVETGDADITVGGYAVARDVVVRVLDFPVAYTPWLILPVKTERQTGFLPPRFGGTNRGGFEVELPFFWAVRPELNITLRPSWIAKRGFKYGFDGEYVFGENGWGEGGATLLPGDDEIDRDDPDTRFSDDRWAYWLRHEHPIDDGIRLGLDVLQMSDNHYPLDFTGVPGDARRLRFSDSRGWTTYARQALFGDVVLTAFDDLQNPNDLDRDDFFLQRLPDVRLSALPLSVSGVPFRGALDVRYTYFHQEDHPEDLYGISPIRGQWFDTGADGVFDVQEPNVSGFFDGADNDRDNFIDPTIPRELALEGDNRFQEGELLANRGHRVEFYPRVSLPGRLGAFEGLAEVGFREALYFPRSGSSETRELWTARVDVRTRLARLYEVGTRRVRHVVEPFVGLAFIGDQDQGGNPLFLPEGAVEQKRVRDADLRARLRNPTDRIEDERVVMAAVTNRFYAAGAEPGDPARELGELRLGTGYDFEDDRLRDIFLEAESRPADNTLLQLVLGYDTKKTRWDEAFAGVRWQAEGGHVLNASYRYLRDIPRVFETFQFSSDVFDDAEADFDHINQVSLFASYRATRRLEVFGSMYLDFEENRAQTAEIGVDLGSRCDCWDLIVSVAQSTRPSQTEVRVELQIAGLNRDVSRR